MNLRRAWLGVSGGHAPMDNFPKNGLQMLPFEEFWSDILSSVKKRDENCLAAAELPPITRIKATVPGYGGMQKKI